jgi:hypothetical protein
MFISTISIRTISIRKKGRVAMVIIILSLLLGSYGAYMLLVVVSTVIGVVVVASIGSCVCYQCWHWQLW